MTITRLASGYIRASGNGPCNWAQWDPRIGLREEDFFPEAGTEFRRELRRLELGLACGKCGFFEVEHHIDGEERASCNGFARTPQIERVR